MGCVASKRAITVNLPISRPQITPEIPLEIPPQNIYIITDSKF